MVATPPICPPRRSSSSFLAATALITRGHCPAASSSAPVVGLLRSGTCTHSRGPASARRRRPSSSTQAHFSCLIRPFTSFTSPLSRLTLVVALFVVSILAPPSSSSSPFSFASAFEQQSILMQIGYLRMSGVDDPSVLAAFLATINHANRVGLVRDVRFEAKVTTIPCETYERCGSLSAADIATWVDPFFASMTNFTAVFKPNYLLSNAVVDAARRNGGIPVIAPTSVRAQDYTSAVGGDVGSSHVIHFNQYITSELVHLFTFMHQSDGCAYSGILYENFSEIPSHVEYTKQMFVDGGMDAPPSIDVGAATDDELFAYFTEDPRRACFIVIATHNVVLNLGKRMSYAARFQDAAAEGLMPHPLHFYGASITGGVEWSIPVTANSSASTVANSQYTVNGRTTTPFLNFHFNRWAPSYISPQSSVYQSQHMSPFKASSDMERIMGEWTRYNATNTTAGAALEVVTTRVDHATGFEVNVSIAIPIEDAEAFGILSYQITVSTAANGDALLSAVGPTNDVIPSAPDDGTLDGYLTTMFFIDSVRVAASANYTEMLENPSRAVPLSWATIIEAFYADPRTVGTYGFDRMARECPPKPMTQICQCNTATLTSYIFRVNASDVTGRGKPYAVFDDTDKGQRDVGSLQFTGVCELNISSRSYPITAIMLDVPEDFVPPAGGAATASRLEKQRMVAASFQERVRSANLAPVAPARPFRFVSVPISTNTSTEVEMAKSGVRYDPFILIGSGEGIIERSDVLTLLPALLQQRMEDPPLTTHDKWQYNIVNLIPTLADYIHALAAYYHDNRQAFTSLHILATTVTEANLISKSLATFGYDVPTSAMVIGDAEGLWESSYEQWYSATGGSDASSSSNSASAGYSASPFVLSSTSSSAINLLTNFRMANKYPNRGRIGLAVSAVLLNTHYQTIPLVGASDIFFATSFSDWWLPEKLSSLSAEQQSLALDPLYWFTQAAADMTTQLSQRAQFDYSANAAQLAYEIAVFSSGGNSYGPISNKSCTARQIAENDRNRECQCTKGPRTMYMLSTQAWQNRVASAPRTKGYSYYLSACGVVYKPYVPPVVDHSLSTGAIVGIVVGCVVFLLCIFVVFFLINILCFGRNNRKAPADATKPFTVVFTDIQSSTALWARAPAAMSEAVEQHHAIMRKIIGKTNGYEVKTIGDSFMIAFKDPNDAVKFSVNVQKALFEADWNSEIDAVYTELIMEAEAANDAIGRRHGRHHDQTEDASTVEKASSQQLNNNGTLVTESVGNGGGNNVGNGANAAQNNNISFQSGMLASINISPASQAQQQQQNTNNANNLNAGGAFVRTLSEEGPAKSPPFGPEVDGQKQQPIPQWVGIGNVGAPVNTNHSHSNSGAVNSAALGAALANHTNSKYIQSSHHTLGVESSSHATASNAAGPAPGQHAEPVWHGIRVRIGVNYGMGEPRKDPVTHGYDYYGTVVNTAARVEGVGHGGQILLTAEMVAAIDPQCISKLDAVAVSLGPQPLRGLDGPIVLTQVVPQSLTARKFPPLRLHIEVDVTEDTATNTDTANNTQSEVTVNPADLAAQLCASKQYSGLVSVEELLMNMHVLTTVFGPTKPKYQQETYGKLGECWGFEKSSKAVKNEGSRQRLLVNLMGKVSKAINMNNKGGITGMGRRRNTGTARFGGDGGTQRSSNMNQGSMQLRSLSHNPNVGGSSSRPVSGGNNTTTSNVGNTVNGQLISNNNTILVPSSAGAMMLNNGGGGINTNNNNFNTNNNNSYLASSSGFHHVSALNTDDCGGVVPVHTHNNNVSSYSMNSRSGPSFGRGGMFGGGGGGDAHPPPRPTIITGAAMNGRGLAHFASEAAAGTEVGSPQFSKTTTNGGQLQSVNTTNINSTNNVNNGGGATYQGPMPDERDAFSPMNNTVLEAGNEQHRQSGGASQHNHHPLAIGALPSASVNSAVML